MSRLGGVPERTAPLGSYGARIGRSGEAPPATRRSAYQAATTAYASGPERPRGPVSGELQDRVDELETLVLEEKTARVKMQQQLERLQEQIEEDRRAKDKEAQDTGGLMQTLRTMQNTVGDLHAIKVERPELDELSRQVQDIVASVGELEVHALGEIAAEVEDHKQGLHHLMDMLDGAPARDEVQATVADAENRVRAAMEEALARVQASHDEAQQLLVGDIDALHADTEQTIAALGEKMEARAKATTDSVATMAESSNQLVEEAREQVRSVTGALQEQLSTNLKEQDSKIEKVDRRVYNTVTTEAARMDEHKRDMSTKLMTAENELSDMVQTLDAKFESLNFTLGTRLDNEMMVTKQRMDGAIEGVWSRVDTHMSDIAEKLRRDTQKVDTIIQQLDRKIGDSTQALAQRFSDHARIHEDHYSTLAGQTDKSLAELHSRMDTLTEQYQAFKVEHDVDKRVTSASVSRVDDKVHETVTQFHGLSSKIVAVEKEARRQVVRVEKGYQERGDTHEKRMSKMGTEANEVKTYFTKTVLSMHKQMEDFNSGWTSVEKGVAAAKASVVERTDFVSEQVNKKMDGVKSDLEKIREELREDVVKQLSTSREQAAGEMAKKVDELTSRISSLDSTLEGTVKSSAEAQKDGEAAVSSQVKACEQKILNAENLTRAVEMLLKESETRHRATMSSMEQNLTKTEKSISKLEDKMSDAELAGTLGAITTGKPRAAAGGDESDADGEDGGAAPVPGSPASRDPFSLIPAASPPAPAAGMDAAAMQQMMMMMMSMQQA